MDRHSKCMNLFPQDCAYLREMQFYIRAFTAVELKSYNAILAPPIYQKSLAVVEAKQKKFVDLLQCTSIYRCALQHSSKKKKKNLFKPLIKIIQVLYFFFFILLFQTSPCSLSSSQALSSALISLIKLSSLSSLKLSSPSHAVAVAIPAHPHLSHLSSSHFSHLSSSHLPAHTVAILAVVVAIPRRPSPCLNPIHFRSVLSLLLQ